MSSNRRNFIKKATAGAAGLAIGTSSANSMTASSYRKVIGANDRLHVAIIGLGRRLQAYMPPIGDQGNNVELSYLCDVMKSQRERAAKRFTEHIDYSPKLENDVRKVIDDKQVDIIINATPDHWHTPGAIMGMQGGKHVYVEKPCSHNLMENKLIVEAQKKYNKVVQMGNQQRSSGHTIEVINEIHNGAIGTPYKALAFYSSSRGEVPNQKKMPVPDGLDWDLFQGPAPRRDYTQETWDYNWHWYGWAYGTAESGNNGTHEIDVARWALQVDYPIHVHVEAEKRHFKDDGWEMYDTMLATFEFSGDKIIQWDGKSRVGYQTYGHGRGTIIYGSEGSVIVNRSMYKRFDRKGKVVKTNESASQESGTALGGGGDMSTAHMVNFFETIRGKEKLNAPISDAAFSQALVHYSNIAYRLDKGIEVDDMSGKIYDREAMKLWGREYEPGWEPKI
ncbi:MAG: Gfo/Idh/MocA family oxidoreductase [Saprospiraceae bacterium]|nr:Gfo/Idh/MocA family oxidoreductase [Saprospiraceae bacterium]